VHLPAEAGDAEEALRRADQRMYAHKGLGRASAEQQSRSVLVAALREHMPELGDHTRGVRELAEAVARHLGLADAEVQRVGSTADLHDIGKVAIPRAILDKPGPLDEEEWHFIRRHTVIGERIIEAAPALADIAAFVRASHERWDGDGYPDALAGEEIPLPARIVAVCDAFDAMIAERPYVASRSTSAAMVELERCAGTQFDPGVIDAFRHVLVQRLASPAGPAH
jgi:HD-GYP domain-containing protein (c-di-GMP phosphodiesterase class II)